LDLKRPNKELMRSKLENCTRQMELNANLTDLIEQLTPLIFLAERPEAAISIFVSLTPISRLLRFVIVRTFIENEARHLLFRLICI